MTIATTQRARRCKTCKLMKPSHQFVATRKACKDCRKKIYDAWREKCRLESLTNPPKGTKQCTKCKETKPIEQFHLRCTTKDGLVPWCKKCCYKYQKNKSLLRNYGITVKDYLKTYKQQNKKCSLCGNSKDTDDRMSWRRFPLDVDHCHKPQCQNPFRSLLCNRCNLALSGIETLMEAGLFDKALSYLKSHSCSTPTSIPKPTTV